jgi:transposase InsO family protein
LGLTLAEVPPRVPGEVKKGLLKLVDDAVAGGWAHARACRTLGISDVRMHRWRQRLHGIGTLEDLAPGGNPVHRLLGWEAEAILSLIEDWGPTDRTHRKLAHRGSYLGIVYVAPSTVLRVAESADVSLPGEPPRAKPAARALPEIPWEPNRIWIWDATHFMRCDRAVYAIVDVVSRFWIGWLSTTEQSSTQVQLLFTDALADQGLLGADGRPLRQATREQPALIAWSDNGPEMKAGDTKTFMALMAILQHHGRPGTPTDQAHIESFFGHLKREFPHLLRIDDPAVLDIELARVRTLWNMVRLHEAVGYVTPDDEHHGRGPRIRRARTAGMKDARRDRIDYNRNQPPENHP